MLIARVAGCSVAFAACCLLPTAYCGEAGAGKHEAVLQQMVKAFDSMSETLKTVQDDETAKAARPLLKKEATGFVAAREQATKLDPPDKAEKERLAKTWQPKVDAAMKQFFTEVRRVERVPGGREVLLEIEPVLRHNGKSPK